MKDLPELRWFFRLDDRVRESHRSQDFPYDFAKDRTEGNKAAPATGR